MKVRQILTLVSLSFLVLFTSQCSKTADGPGSSSSVTLNTFNNKAVGASANELLSAEKPSIVLEVNYMKGFALQSSTLNSLNSFLSTYTKKGAFQVVQKEITASGKDSLSLAEIDKIERQNRTTFNSTNQVSVYLLVTDGGYNPENTVGFAYRNTSIVLLGKTISKFSGGANQVPRSKLELGTLEHEFGHLFGLVNVGTPMQTTHNDPANPAHCVNSKCLMYYQTETSRFLGTLMANNIPSFDTNCRNDLIANGGK